MAEPAMGSIIQNLSKPIDVANIQGGTQAGLQIGVQLADQKAKLAQMSSEMAYKRQALEQQKQEHMATLMDKAFQEQDPVIRKARLTQARTTGSNLGINYSDDFYDAIQKSDDFRQTMQTVMSRVNTADPNVRAQLIQGFTEAGIGGPVKAADFVNKVTEQEAKERQARALSDSKFKLVDAKSTANTIKDLVNSGSVSPDDVAILKAGPSNPEFINAIARAVAVQKTKKATELENKTTTANAAAQNADSNTQNANTKVGQLTLAQKDQARKERNTQSEIQNRKDQIELGKQRLAQMGDLMGRRLDLSDQRRIQGVQGPLDKKLGDIEVFINRANLGDDRLKPGMTWIDMADVAGDYNALITQNNRAAFAGEKSRSFTDFRKLFTDFEGKVKGKEQGGPSVDEINLFQDRIAAMRDVMTDYHDTTAKSYLQSKVATKLLKPDMAEAYFQTRKKGENSVWDMNLGKPALKKGETPTPRTGAGTQPPAGTPLKTPSKAFLDALKQKLPDANQRNSYLKSNGYQPEVGP